MFHFFTPRFVDGIPTTKYIAVISYGEHCHPPPPPRKILPGVKDQLIRIVREFGAAEATARRLVASPLLSIMLNGKMDLTAEHIALANHDAINHIIRKERLIECPYCTDFQGAQHVMRQQRLSDPYIRHTVQYPDGHFVILCQLKEQSRLLFESYEILADKTFSRTRCNEFEVNSWSNSTQRAITIGRVFTDFEGEDRYYQAFSLIFKTAERDMGRRISWGHLVPQSQSTS